MREFYFSKAGRKRSISYYTAEVAYDFHGFEIRYYNSWRKPVNLSLTKKIKISELFVVTLWKLPPTLLAGMSKCQVPQFIFTVDFKAFSA